MGELFAFVISFWYDDSRILACHREFSEVLEALDTRNFMFKHQHSEIGQGLVEYALIIILIAMVIVVALSLVPPPVANVFNSVALTLGSI